MAKPLFPKTRPADIDQATWFELQKNPQCSRINECGSLCALVDENGFYKVNVHHIVSRARGGSSTLDNLDVICECENQSIGPRRDPNFAGKYYFDNAIETSGLRQHQKERAYDLPQRKYRDLFLNDYSRILKRILLFAWSTGAGKTLGVCAFLFGLNQLRAPLAARRVRRVLWMVHQELIVQLLAKELEGDKGDKMPSDLVKHGIIDHSPEVWVPGSTSEILARPHADITLICQQTFWDAKGRALSKEDRRRILATFDAIVIDEGHFGIEKYLEIMEAAPSALKISITATPFDIDGNFLSKIENGKYRDLFVLASTYDYATGREAGIYKDLMPFTLGVKEGRYRAIGGGKAEIGVGRDSVDDTNTQHPLNVYRTNAIAEEALRIARTMDAGKDYQNVVMLRVGNKPKATAVTQALMDNQNVKQQGVIAVHSDTKGTDQLHHDRNPWMRIARFDNGQLQVPPDGARFMVCIDMGAIALNNRYCSIIAWRDPIYSMIDIVQRIGRALRAIGKSVEGDGQHVVLLWRDDLRFVTRLQLALNYILNGEEGLQQSFVLLGDLRNPAAFVPEDIPTTLSVAQKTQLISVAGTRPDLPPEEIATICFPGGDQQLHDIGTKFVNDVIRPNPMDKAAVLKAKKTKAKMLGGITAGTNDKTGQLPQQPIKARITYVQNEAPPDTHTVDRLLEAVVEFPDLLGDATYWRDEIINKNTRVINSISARLHDRDKEIYKAHKLIWRVSEVISGIKGEKNGARPVGFVPPRPITALFIDKYMEPAGLKATLGKDCWQIAAPLVNMAASELLGLPDLKESSDAVATRHVQIVDALLDEANQDLIQRVALRRLIQRHPRLVPGLAAVFASLIKELEANKAPD